VKAGKTMNGRRGLESSGKWKKSRLVFSNSKSLRKERRDRIGMDNYNGAEDKCYKHQILHGVLEELLRDWLVTLCV
jgi:hypothetical protein